MLIKYIKSVLWRVTKRLSYIEDARCLEVNNYSSIDKPRLKTYMLTTDMQEKVGVVSFFDDVIFYLPP